MARTKSVPRANGDANKVLGDDRPVHDWYRFVLSYPPHLVREYLTRFGIDSTQTVLDPFCGTGTTLVECKKLGVPSVGVEGNPMAHFASSVKLDWSPDPEALSEHARQVAENAFAALTADEVEDDFLPLFSPRKKTGSFRTKTLRMLDPEQTKLLLADSISPLPLHKTLVLLECLQTNLDPRFQRHELLALARALVFSISNLHFGPEVGVGPPKENAAAVTPWLEGVTRMVTDLRELQDESHVPSVVHHADARQVSDVLKPNSIDAVITSPPYPNEKDYTRTTRLESVLLGFVHNKAELRTLKRGLVRSNTREVYKEDDDDRWISEHPEIQAIAASIEARRIELGKTSGFERMYARVTKLYFGGMARHLANLRGVLRPGARLAYVVGDQASYLRIMIRTGTLLAEIAQALGYEVLGIDLFRTRLATATKKQLREEVVLLRWPGPSKPA